MVVTAAQELLLGVKRESQDIALMGLNFLSWRKRRDVDTRLSWSSLRAVNGFDFPHTNRIIMCSTGHDISFGINRNRIDATYIRHTCQHTCATYLDRKINTRTYLHVRCISPREDSRQYEIDECHTRFQPQRSIAHQEKRPWLISNL